MGVLLLLTAATLLVVFGCWRCLALAADGPFGLVLGVALLALCITGATFLLIGGTLYGLSS